MEEINIYDLFRYCIKNITIFFIVVGISLLSALTYNHILQQAKYKSSTTLVLVSKNENSFQSSQMIQSEVQVNEKLVTTYSEIVKSKRVLKQVIKKLALKMSIDELVKMVSVESVNDTSLIKITVQDADNYEAKQIADKTAEVFKDEITKIYNLENVSIIDEAQVSKKPFNVHIIRQTVIFVIIGFLISFIIVFIKYYFDTTVKSQEEIEDKLNISVIGTIPEVHYKDKQERIKKGGK